MSPERKAESPCFMMLWATFLLVACEFIYPSNLRKGSPEKAGEKIRNVSSNNLQLAKITHDMK